MSHDVSTGIPPQGRRRSDRKGAPTRLVPDRTNVGGVQRPTDFELLEKRFQSALRQRAGRSRQGIDSGLHPVMVRLADRLVLVYGRHRREFEAGEHVLRRLTEISQVPAEVFMGLVHASPATIDGVAERLARRIATLPTGLCPDATATIRRACERLLVHGRANQGHLDAHAVRRFHATLRPAMETLVSLATDHEYRATASAVRQMLLTLPPLPWHRALCVNCTGRDPGYRHLVETVFERFLEDQPGQYTDPSLRVLRLEGRGGLEQALTLAATALASGRLGTGANAAADDGPGPRFYDEPAEVIPISRQAG